MKFLGYPLMCLYALVVRLRNFCYEKGYFFSDFSPVFTLVVGNLRVGGTGKTPTVAYLIDLLSDKKIVTLSRGYGRSTKGFRLAEERDSPKSIGDEPYQLYKKFHQKINVAVGEDRLAATKKISKTLPETEIILLDDAFQHRKLCPDFSILLTEEQKLFTEDNCFPVGRLREPRAGAARADVILVTKCQNTTKESSDAIRSKIAKYAPQVPVLFVGIKYAPLPISGPVLLVSGIADGSGFEAFCREKYEVIGHEDFPDHHNYTESDFEKITHKSKGNTTILTTEKDFAKLQPLLLRKIKVVYLPIETFFLFDEEPAFLRCLEDGFTRKKRKPSRK